MLRGQPQSGTQKQRLNTFYRPQAESYDQFRERLLHGRKDMLQLLNLKPGQRVVEIGGGTARNLDYYSELIPELESVEVIDLCPALIEQAEKRCHKWPNVNVIESDACTWQPSKKVDRVYFSYSLTMIPNWQLAIKNAIAMLRPDGQLGVVDFYVSPSQASFGRVQHGRFNREFWPRWFSHDGVELDPERLSFLQAQLDCVELSENFGSVPYLPVLQVPYYIYIGH